MSRRWSRIFFLGAVSCTVLCLVSVFSGQEPASKTLDSIEIEDHSLSRPARPWEFLDAVGKRAGIFGNESGGFEAWVYPLKLLRDFDVRFVLGDRTLPASALVRTLVERPEGPTLTFASDSFTVKESWLVPPDENGAIIRFEIDTWEPLTIEASFLRDFQLMWPAAIGGTYMSWDPELHAYKLGEETRKFAALVGSPAAVSSHPEFFSNSFLSERSTMRLATVNKGKTVQYIFLAGSAQGPDQALAAYRKISADPGAELAATQRYYEDFLRRTLELDIPDSQLQAAYDWSRISVVQGIVSNPFLGTGLVAGYRTSGDSARPGFAWFFGRDSLWTDLALDSIGDYADTRTALDFIAKYQRKDGKIEHEISQTATLVDWWKGMPYAYASADATPLFLIAMNDYATSSGDAEFVKQHWDKISRAYKFFRSTFDANGLPKNLGVGHGWVEGGPLRESLETESYQSGLGVAALAGFASLARTDGQLEQASVADEQAKQLRQAVNKVFWNQNGNYLEFGLDVSSKAIDLPSVLSTAPMWFGAFDAPKANGTIDQLANWDQSTDWGMRIISERSPLFGPTGYHFGSVWPLFTGWAAVGEYLNHRPIEAFANLRANALLALDGPLGHVTEVLSGAYYEPLSTASPHQIWSSAMVISPIVRGMMGLSVHHTTLTFAPHFPPDWNTFGVRNLQFCGTTVELQYRRTVDSIHLAVRSPKMEQCGVTFSPALSKSARVTSVRFSAPNDALSRVVPNSNDQHLEVDFPLQSGELDISIADDFAISADENLPRLGAESSNLKISREQWSADGKEYTLHVAGLSGREYVLKAYGRSIQSVEGGALARGGDGQQEIQITFPPGEARYTERDLRIHF